MSLFKQDVASTTYAAYSLAEHKVQKVIVELGKAFLQIDPYPAYPSSLRPYLQWLFRFLLVDYECYSFRREVLAGRLGWTEGEHSHLS
jgi:hypothetical protein